MIRKQSLEEPLFYAQHEIAMPSKQNLYMRFMESGLDWQKLAKPFEAAFTKDMGRPTDPVVYLKIFLISYFEDITYDTRLAERITDSIAIRKFLGYNLSEKTPDHSSISRSRGRIAAVCSIEEVLGNLVKECIAIGLVDGELAGVDGSLVSANASLSSLQHVETGKSVGEHLKEVAERNKALKESGEGKKEKPNVSNEEFVSKTDPDAKIAQKYSKPRDMCYLVTHVTDSKSKIIIGAKCARADAGEREAARPVLEQARDNLLESGVKLKKAVADTGFDGSDFCTAVEELGIEPYINYKADTNQKPDGFKKESFIYYKEHNCYICPFGCLLRYHGFSKSVGLHIYKSSYSDCLYCPDRCKCIEGKAGVRHVSRHPNEESREANIARCHTDEGRAILKARKHIVEPPFGHMKTYGGMDLINCRGLAKVNVKTVMGAVAYDLVKWLKAKEKAVNIDPISVQNDLLRAISDGFLVLMRIFSASLAKLRILSRSTARIAA